MIKHRFNSKRTKIVATIGPKSRNEETLRAVIRAGIDVARINFSHGTHQEHGDTIDRIRRIAEEEHAIVSILCDIQGPKIRLGKIANEPLMLETGDQITLTLGEADGTNNVVSLPHPEFVPDITPGTKLLIGDGDLQFDVISNTGQSLICEVKIGGPLGSRKGVMATNARLSLSAITDQDRKDIEFALSKKPDFIAMSFVRSADDLREMKWLIKMLGGSAAVIAKIEKHEALENLEQIIEIADGIMVARGDLGLELAPEDVPFHQKRIIKLCNAAGKPVITATEMLKSMESSPRPTRAEASDVYNAILDGTDAVMLSGETASGNYPAVAVETMANIASMAESHMPHVDPASHRLLKLKQSREAISDAVSWATVNVADALGCKAIVTATLTGYTTRHVAKERPNTPIICVTPNEQTYRRMVLVWGVYPLLIKENTSIDEMIGTEVRAARDEGLVVAGDNLVIIAGVPAGIGGQTNFLKVHTVGEAGELDAR